MPLLGCVVANKLLFGAWTPVSGAAKSSFPLISGANWVAFADVLNYPLGGVRPHIDLVGRVLQLLVPVLAALVGAFVVFAFRSEPDGYRVRWAIPNQRLAVVLLTTGAGIMLLAAYNFLFVPLFDQGHWYVPVSVTFVTLVARERMRVPQYGGVGRSIAAAAVIVLTVVFFMRLHRHEDYHAKYAAFYFDEAPAIKAIMPAPKLLSYDDGIVEWATGLHGMSATGRGLDADAARAHRDGALVELARSRGFNHLTSAVYVDWSTLPRSPRQVSK